MTNGIGATIGTLTAGEIVYKFCAWKDCVVNGETQSLLVGIEEGGWQTCWFIFATFALVVGVTFALVFKPEKRK